MVLVALKCPHCGGDIQLDDAHEFGFCLYCGTKIIVRDEVVNQTNNFHADVRNVYNGQTTVTNNYSVKPTSGQCIYPILSEGHYEGPMVEGKPHGKGIYFWPGGVRYEGEFVEGRIEGFGKKVYGEAYYEGYFRNNLRHGHGRMVNDNGLVIEGEFVDDRQSGPFRITGRNSNGSTYVFEGICVDGAWKSGKVVYSDGTSYEGEYDGYILKKGVMRFPDGDWLEGSWKNQDPDGRCRYHYRNGNYFDGEWKDGEMVGNGPLHTVKGNTYDTWDDEGNPTRHRLRRLLNRE